MGDDTFKGSKFADSAYSIDRNGHVVWKTRHEFPGGVGNPTIDGVPIGTGGGVTTWLGLTDTAAAYIADAICHCTGNVIDLDLDLRFDGVGFHVGDQDGGFNNWGGRIWSAQPTLDGHAWAPIIMNYENQSGVDINRYDLVAIDTGGTLRVRQANASAPPNQFRAIGIALEDIGNGVPGRVAVGICLLYDDTISGGGGWGVGNSIFTSTTPGAKQRTPTIVSGQLRQRVGFCVANQIALYVFDAYLDTTVP